MMDGINLAAMVEIITRFGTLGILVVVWWNDRKEIKEHKNQMTRILEQYNEDMAEQRRMYASNVKLVESFESVAGDLKDVVIMNTQIMTNLSRDVETNQYCPMIRLEKAAKGVQG